MSSLKIPSGDRIITPTISMGISYFDKKDEDISDVLKRADKAMYKSKEDGRNKVNIL